MIVTTICSIVTIGPRSIIGRLQFVAVIRFTTRKTSASRLAGNHRFLVIEVVVEEVVFQ